MKEFIFGIDEENSDWAEVFYGWIRNNSPELIRCKDCRLWKTEDCYMCNSCKVGTTLMTESDFCSRAERKEE